MNITNNNFLNNNAIFGGVLYLSKSNNIKI
jgi:hypothetical protein